MHHHICFKFRMKGDLEKIRKRIVELQEWEDILSKNWSKHLRGQFEYKKKKESEKLVEVKGNSQIVKQGNATVPADLMGATPIANSEDSFWNSLPMEELSPTWREHLKKIMEKEVRK